MRKEGREGCKAGDAGAKGGTPVERRIRRDGAQAGREAEGRGKRRASG